MGVFFEAFLRLGLGICFVGFERAFRILGWWVVGGGCWKQGGRGVGQNVEEILILGYQVKRR